MSQTSKMWCLDTLSSIVGTVIGIVLTFGVTFWIEYKNKQNDNKKATMVVLENVGMINQECIKTLMEVLESEPILEKILTLSEKEVNKMPEDSISYYMTYAFPNSLFIYEDLGRNLLNSNFDILRSTENYKFLTYVSFFYSMYDDIEKLYEKDGPKKLLDQINEILLEIAIQEGSSDNSNRWNLTEIVKSDKIKIYIRAYLDLFVPMIKYKTKTLSVAADNVGKTSGYSEEEFNEFFISFQDQNESIK